MRVVGEGGAFLHHLGDTSHSASTQTSPNAWQDYSGQPFPTELNAD